MVLEEVCSNGLEESEGKKNVTGNGIKLDSAYVAVGSLARL